MAIEVKKPGSSLNNIRLSRTGKIIIAIIAVILIVIGIVVISTVQSKSHQEKLAQPILDAVEHSVLVCKGISSEDVLSSYINRIESEKAATDKADVAQEMIQFVTKQAEGNQAQLDELNGARNRITIALKKYNQEK